MKKGREGTGDRVTPTVFFFVASSKSPGERGHTPMVSHKTHKRTEFIEGTVGLIWESLGTFNNQRSKVTISCL